MSGIFLLAWRYIVFNKIKTFILIACLTITLFLPIAVNTLVQHFNETLLARAQATPLVLGAKGNRYDLVLKSLYFSTEYADTINMGDLATVKQRGYGKTIPLYIRYSAHKVYVNDADITDTVNNAPLIGTSLAYFKFRNLTVQDGSLPLELGDAVVGSRAAAALGLKPGDSIVSNPLSVYDPSRSFQLKMAVVGVLNEAGTPDDDAIFIDIKTAWVIDGIGHGHEDMAKVKDPSLLDQQKSTKGNVVSSAKIFEYQEITDANRASFHFHGDDALYPLTAALLIPKSDKLRTIAESWFNNGATRTLLEPTAVMQELMGIVFKVKRFFEANFALIVLSTVLFMSLVIMLSYRLRKREMATLYKIGCARSTAFWLQTAEIGIIFLVSLTLAGLATVLLLQAAPFFIHFLQA